VARGSRLLRSQETRLSTEGGQSCRDTSWSARFRTGSASR
jgi:hypothetical protein